MRSTKGELRITFGPGSTRPVQRLVPPRPDCTIDVGIDHGWRTFGCGRALDGSWERRGPPRDNADYAGGTALPPHAAERGRWLAPIDEEGILATYPSEGEAYVRLYPRHFTAVGPRRGLDNPDLDATLQTYRYVTMAGASRAAVAGEAAIGCLRLSFWSWVTLDEVDGTERAVAAFLSGLRLEEVGSAGSR